METENNTAFAEGTNKKRKMLPWIIVAAVAAVAVGYIIFLVFVLKGKNKPSDDEVKDDPSKITVWRVKEEKIELHPERTDSKTITDFSNRVLNASGTTVYTYDEADNPVKEITCDESGRETRREETEYKCDSEGRWLQVLSKTYEDGRQTYAQRHEFLYDDRGNRIESKLYATPEGKTEESLWSERHYEYDENNRLVKEGPYIADQYHFFEYNEKGQLTRTRVGEKTESEYTYDNAGNLQKEVEYVTRQISEKLRVGDIMGEWEYKNGHKLSQEYGPDGNPLLEYDEDGNLIKQTRYTWRVNWQGDQSYVNAVIEYRYENGQLMEVTTTQYSSQGNEKGTSRDVYTYDKDGSVKEEFYNPKKVLVHRVDRDKNGNVVLEERFTEKGELIFRLERSYVSYRVSIWALTNSEVLDLRSEETCPALSRMYRY